MVIAEGWCKWGKWHVRKINGIPLYWSLKHWIYFKTTLSIPSLYFSCHSSSYSVSIPTKVRMIVTFPPLFLLICFKLLITQTFFDFPTRFELSGSTVFYLPNQPIRAPEQIRDRLSYQLVYMAFLLLRRRRLSHETSQWRDRSMGKWLYSPTLPFGSPYENISVNNNIVNLEQFNATGGKYIV